MEATRHSPGSPEGRRDAPSFRVIPPVAIGLPWLAGWSIGLHIGDGFVWRGTGVVGWILIALFAVWNGWSLLLFRYHRTGLLPGQATTTILTIGPYRLTRNPLYVGLLVLHVGASMVADSVLALASLPIAWASVHWGSVIPEERYLRATLGHEYDDYCRKVRRWL